MLLISNNICGSYLDCDQGMNLFGLGRTRLSIFSWTSIRKRLLGEFAVVIIPILSSNHFSVAIIDKSKHLFTYMDSKKINSPKSMFEILKTQISNYERKYQNSPDENR